MSKRDYVWRAAVAIMLLGCEAQAAGSASGVGRDAADERHGWSGFYAGIVGGARSIVGGLDVPSVGLVDFNGSAGEAAFDAYSAGNDRMVLDRLPAAAFAGIWSGGATTVEGTDSGLFAVTPNYGDGIGGRLGRFLTREALVDSRVAISWSGYDADVGGSAYGAGRGGVTTDAGMETTLADRFMLKSEQPFTQNEGWDLAGINAFHGSAFRPFPTDLNHHAYRQHPAVKVEERAYDWSGVYVSAAGRLSGLVVRSDSAQTDRIASESIVGELGIGYDHEIGTRYVVGVQASTRYGNVAPAIGAPELDGASFATDYGFDVVARAGFKLNEGTLTYLLGGWSRQHLEVVPTGDPGDDRASDGFVLGGGLETAVTSRVSAGIEYRFARYNPENLSISPSLHSGAVTLKYRFD